MMGRNINPNLKHPPVSATNELKKKPIGDMVYNLLLANGVNEELLTQYGEQSKTWKGHNHCSVSTYCDTFISS